MIVQRIMNRRMRKAFINMLASVRWHTRKQYKAKVMYYSNDHDRRLEAWMNTVGRYRNRDA